jgi:ubiquinone/menaquinone biosynthesis C-methylase UbiE
MNELSANKQRIQKAEDKIAPKRTTYFRRNSYYNNDLQRFFSFNIPEGAKVLEIGCGTGDLLNSLKPLSGVGIDISGEMISLAKSKFPHLEFHQMDAENITLSETFDYVILSDTLGLLEDIQRAFKELTKVITPESRIIITYHNFFWLPVLSLAEKLNLKMPQPRLNWLNRADISGLLNLENFDIIKSGRRFLCPKYIPFISWFINKYVAFLPLFNQLCFTGYITARLQEIAPQDNDLYSVTVVIPARNEKGNIEDAVKRTPNMGKHTEIIFVEGNSTDDTLTEIKRVCEAYKDVRDLSYYEQPGKGKGDAVRKGFANAKGDILMILDADLTVPPEDLPKFYNAIATGKGEYINGTRLVYPMEKEAMRGLNLLGNKFFSMMFTWLLGQRMKDTLCGTKVLSRKNYEKLIANRGYFGDFDPFGDFDLIFGAAKLNLKTIEVPIRYRAREYGDTNISRFRHGLILLRMVFYAMNKIKFIGK